jgi:hypothetical protein
MADVGRDQDLAPALPRHEALGVAERSGLETCVDADLVGVVGHGLALALRETEAPVLRVVGRAVGDPVGMLGERVQMGLELAAREPARRDRRAVAHDVEVRVPQVDHAPPAPILDPGVREVPLPGHRPIEGGGSGGHLEALEGDLLADDPERLAHPVAGDRATEGLERTPESHHRVGAVPAHARPRPRESTALRPSGPGALAARSDVAKSSASTLARSKSA